VDRKDFQLLACLFEDARQSYRSLGRRIGLTAPAVRERLQRLESQGILRGFWLRPEATLFDRADCIFLFGGPIGADRLRETHAEPDVAWVAEKMDGGASVGVWTNDPDASEKNLVRVLGQAVSGKTVSPKRQGLKLARIDWKVLSALLDDPRRDLQSLCESTHLSSKTVRKRLTGLLRNGSVAISPILGPFSEAGDILYTISVIGPIEFSEIQHILGEATLLRVVEGPKSQFALCRGANLGEVLSRTAALARHPEVHRSFVSLNRELWVNVDFTRRLVSEKAAAG
jgi:DNA-binding Lrp family transcriptional regulator